jgi:hypothetical protein
MESKKALDTPYIDDIDCKSWLEEIGLSQYSETFYANFTSGGTGFLSRKRLAQVRLQHFPHMNITDFEHQKVLLQHIKHTLKYTYQSPVRIKETQQSAYAKFRTLSFEDSSENEAKADKKEYKSFGDDPKSSAEPKEVDEKEDKKDSNQIASKDEEAKAKKKRAKRRHTFDDKAWEAINKSRSTGEAKTAVDMLREGVVPAAAVRDMCIGLFLICFNATEQFI